MLVEEEISKELQKIKTVFNNNTIPIDEVTDEDLYRVAVIYNAFGSKSYNELIRKIRVGYVEEVMVNFIETMLDYLEHCNDEVSGKIDEEGHIGLQHRSDLSTRLTFLNDGGDSYIDVKRDETFKYRPINDDFKYKEAIIHMALEMNMSLINGIRELNDRYLYRIVAEDLNNA